MLHTFLSAILIIGLFAPVLAHGDEASLYGSSAEEFQKLEEARQPLDPARLNEPLLSAAIFHETNVRRAELKLPALQPQAQVRAAALGHAQAMAAHKTLSHGTPWDLPSKSAADRLQAQGLQPQLTAENVAFNFVLRYESGKPFHTRQESGRTVFSYTLQGPPLAPHTYVSFAQTILTQWMDSPPHRHNIVLPEAQFLGVGCALAQDAQGFDTIYATQNFFTPFPPPGGAQP